MVTKYQKDSYLDEILDDIKVPLPTEEDLTLVRLYKDFYQANKDLYNQSIFEYWIAARRYIETERHKVKSADKE